MTTLTSQIVCAATTAAQHHDWIAAVSAALDTLGVVQTADTGQVDLTTGSVALPASSAGNANAYVSSPAVDQIRKLSAATLPDIYIRFDFGIFGNNNTSQPQALYSYPAIWVSIGKGSDGAGNLTRIQSSGSPAQFASHVNNGSNTFAGSSAPGSTEPSQIAQACDFASDGQNYLTIMMGENAPSYENYSIFNLGIERTINPSTGAYDGDGVCAFCGHAGYDTWYYSDFVNSREWFAGGNIPSISPPFNIAGSGTEILLFPLIGCTTIPKGSPLVGIAYYSTSISAAVAFPATQYSVSHTYKACPRSLSSADPYATGTKLALRFE